MERSEAWFIAIVAAVMGFILGSAWSDVTHHSSKGWLYDYQTLIAGFAAVAAGFVTVNAMTKSDERQKELTLRGAKLLAMRAAVVSRYFYNLIVEFSDSSKVFRDRYDVPSPPMFSAQDVAKVRAFQSRLTTGLSFESIASAVPIFPPTMAARYEILKSVKEKSDILTKLFESIIKTKATVPAEAIKKAAINFAETIEFSAPHITLFAKDLEQLESSVK
ncbi:MULTISPECIES: hypothetical protein [unclassified Mesorhizobium]|uniref:hypothetical protein n=1 Tax=unclassified Mesorhizobium TaxID=325217 RepID=UPI00112A0146|nr:MULTISPECIES: hypothetical protein [unclassified Mesorhizobium]TPL05096.1 hypothetical protein FJ567_01915 [Mesorhizobium sp. B2-4-16]TPL74469.1 hypothetical protein FJ956_07400 [Mesorhizobium sp. B2-4-3]